MSVLFTINWLGDFFFLRFFYVAILVIGVGDDKKSSSLDSKAIFQNINEVMV